MNDRARISPSSPRITDVLAIPLRYHRDCPIADARYTFSSRQAVIVVVETNSGLRGIGEAAAFGGSVESLCAVVRSDLRPLLLDEDPRHIPALWQKLFSITYQRARRGLVLAAISGVDTALWDIAAKIAGVPLGRFFGADDTPIPVYASGGFYPADGGDDSVIEEVTGAVKRGIGAVKIKVAGLPLAEDAARVRLVRTAIGDTVDLMIDANTNYRPREAVGFWEQIRDVGITWFEEPTSFDDLEGARYVAERIGCPVAGYETEGTAAGFRELIRNRVIDIAQPDVTWCGGVTEARRIVALAEASELPVTTHAYGSAVGFFANLHVLAAVPRRMKMELDVTANGLRDELTEPSPSDLLERGAVSLPDGPGLGVELRDDALISFQVA